MIRSGGRLLRHHIELVLHIFGNILFVLSSEPTRKAELLVWSLICISFAMTFQWHISHSNFTSLNLGNSKTETGDKLRETVWVVHLHSEFGKISRPASVEIADENPLADWNR
jgi:hypothetical protein